jgi:hypothetical protein
MKNGLQETEMANLAIFNHCSCMVLLWNMTLVAVNTVATPYLLQDVKVGTVFLFEYYIESAYGWKASSLYEAFCPFELFDLFHKRETTACVRRRWIFRYTFDNALLHHVCGRFRNLGSVLR